MPFNNVLQDKNKEAPAYLLDKTGTPMLHNTPFITFYYLFLASAI